MSCGEALPNSESQQWWLYLCGHLRCVNHAHTMCCESCSYVKNLMEDDVVRYTVQYIKYVQSKESEIGDAWKPAVAPLMAIVAARKTALLKQAQMHQQAFQSMETLTLSPAMKDKPWICIKCSTECPSDVSTCKCGYVNLQRVEIGNIECENEPKKTPEPSNTTPEVPNLWTCPECSYEYNEVGEKKCDKCGKDSGKDSPCSLM